MERTLEIIRALRSTPPLPSVAVRLLELVKDPDFSIDELVALVSTDPSLTGRVLKLTNSALFALSGEVTSVGDAVAFIGTRSLTKLGLVCCAANHFRDASASIYGTPADLWTNTVAVATACEWLARRCRFDPASAFTAGILHNVGKVALTQTTAEDLMPTPSKPTSLLERETALFGIDHAEASGIVAQSWKLPRDLVTALRHHHDTDSQTSGPILAAILAAGESIAHAAGLCACPVGAEAVIPPAAVERLGLDDSAVESAVAGVIEEISHNAELLNLQIGHSR